MNVRFTSLTIIACLAAVGCVRPAQVHNAEIGALSDNYTPKVITPALVQGRAGYLDLSTLEGSSKFATNLSDVYLSKADEASQAQDATAAALIAAAAVAAGGTLFGAHADLLKVTGLTAGTILAGDNYLKPAEAAVALLAASEHARCVAKAGWDAWNIKEKIPSDAAAANRLDKVGARVVGDGIAKARLLLRDKLKRQTPNYGTIVKDILETERAAHGTDDPGQNVASATPDYEAAADDALKLLNKEVAACFGTGT